MGAICCHGNQSSDPILPKTLCSQSLRRMMLQMKFDLNRTAGLRDIHVWKCERMDAWTEGRRLKSHPISSPRAFGSGELTMSLRQSTWTCMSPQNLKWPLNSENVKGKHCLSYLINIFFQIFIQLCSAVLYNTPHYDTDMDIIRSCCNFFPIIPLWFTYYNTIYFHQPQSTIKGLQCI